MFTNILYELLIPYTRVLDDRALFRGSLRFLHLSAGVVPACDCACVCACVCVCGLTLGGRPSRVAAGVDLFCCTVPRLAAGQTAAACRRAPLSAAAGRPRVSGRLLSVRVCGVITYCGVSDLSRFNTPVWCPSWCSYYEYI